ncbi:uncharacterized protein LOC124941983 [Impatiens glandulifera]|uniref:uncharacterized protein LOC124941983 n=1 Tax=Impatiens glandulifera TaxID=253017 RepID=UPI001FB0C74C|nr:uncharacterized protein LOC124941983 [Impatiens glandulifera]
MEDLFSHFTFLSDQALHDKTFDPATIEDLMKLFEIESYKAWAALELEQEQEAEDAEESLREAEESLDSAMESAMEEFRKFEEEMDIEARSQLRSLELMADSVRKLGNSMERAATITSKKYMETAMNSASASMKNAWKGISSYSNKIHPS